MFIGMIMSEPKKARKFMKKNAFRFLITEGSSF